MEHITKKLLAGLLVFFWAATVFAAGQNQPTVIPLPQKMVVQKGAFKLTAQTRIYTDWASRETGKILAEQLRQVTGYPLKTKLMLWADAAIPNSILLTTTKADSHLGPEGYELIVTANSVVVRAPTQAGLFYGAQTLLQLLPPEVVSARVVAKANWDVPCVQIEDRPRFKWRGLMLDVSRHFYNKAEVKRLLDLMAMYKLNMFHWHLTDDQGWRIEIKKYPLLTQVGAWRKDIGFGLDPKSSTAYNANGEYGGYYTQADIREVVAYAAARHITIVPEIEMPGHSTAALAAYPQFGCVDAPFGTDSSLNINGINSPANRGVFNPANPQTFEFLDNILSEVFKLFPGQYVHIGGDEVPKEIWEKNPACLALMKREGFKDQPQLQSWFTARMEKFVSAHSKTLIGWSEITRGGLPDKAVVMDWLGVAKETAIAGHDVVMTTPKYCYLNYYQSMDRTSEPRAQGGYISLRRSYFFEPIPEGLSPENDSHILGAQGNLWTEWIASLSHVEYMLFPRLFALAEIEWSSKDSRNWPDFQRRVEINETRLDKLGVNYRHGGFEPETARITNPYIDASISLDYPGFAGLSVDSLGKKHFPLVTIRPPGKLWRPTLALQHHSRIEYFRPGPIKSQSPRWAIEIKANAIELESHWSADDPPEPLVFVADNSVSHVTLLGQMNVDGSIQLPAIMHFPDQGSFRISIDTPEIKTLGYSAGGHQAKTVAITFPGATQENPVVKYRWEIICIHPELSVAESDARFDGFRRNWLNIFQLSPHWRMLSNHVNSDTCAFCYYEYADIAKETPQLATNFMALDMVRQTLERIFEGAKAYGMPGYGDYPTFSADTYPSLLIAATDYVQGSKDNHWLTIHYDQIKAWADKMLATDDNGDGLVKYALSGNSGSWPEKIKYRPSNWWDTIGFAYEDAYGNALAYRALRGMSELAAQSNHPSDQDRYAKAADKLKAVYFKTFYNPATGVLAGWRSADGQLHDYYFPWVSGIAIHYGLVPKEQANSIMDHLLAKMKEVGYTRFDLGLPGNLISVARKDYVDLHVRFGGGIRADNSDGFQIYENGGATACFAYFTLAALYDLGRIDDGDRILIPLVQSFAEGNFQGHGPNGMSKDWKTWNGECNGYEGLLTDNYYALLALLDREAAIKRRAH